ncbi:GNAT family N-acetyltransferase [Colwellia sp. 12G3]|uniref:GNAT family N-acetyltransferase n=1 Tax=Colwellia sp. 12G3 TaxID=2058299 RepID=UPI000C31D849|nr:GNAT family N-acetyltransferase [Colwellia sp. 12G3]PKI17351.1 N-acetyltransferase [Colwellia sp. 12G3]
MHSFATERLLIRPLIMADEAFYCYQYTDKKMMRVVGEPLTQAKAQAAFHRALAANNLVKNTVRTWAIVDKKTDEIIGTQAFSWLAASQTTKPSTLPIDQVEIGIMLATKANGKLLPEEAVSAIMEYGFKHFNIDRINAFYANKNRATQRILRKIGYVFEASVQDTTSENGYQYFDQSQWQAKVITQLFATPNSKK